MIEMSDIRVDNSGNADESYWMYTFYIEEFKVILGIFIMLSGTMEV